MNAPWPSRIDAWRRNASIVGALGFAAWIADAILSRAGAFQSYWFAWVFWSGLGFGALSIMIMRSLTGGAWAEAVQPSAQAAALTIPLMGLLLVPVFFAMADVFPWATAHGLPAASPHKRAYLTVPWFIVRAVAYFVVLGALALALRRPQVVAPEDGSTHPVGGIGVIVYGLCMLFASTDWIVSLEPRWSSTMLVVIAMAWQFLAALALMVMSVTAQARAGPPELFTTKQFHDLGNLLLAFVTFWIYVSFAQFLIIWSGNLPREISWYLPRSSGGWQYVAVALAALQFGLPFALLLSRAAKRLPERLFPIAALIFMISALDVFWLIVPSFRPGGFSVHWTDVAAFVGLGGIWMGAFLTFSKSSLINAIARGKEAHG